MATNKRRKAEDRAQAFRTQRRAELLARGGLVLGGIVLTVLALWTGGSFVVPVGEHQSGNGYGHHAPEDTAVDYKSFPPTSGSHWPSPSAWGIYDYEQRDERIVHNLEHAGIVIDYNKISSEDLAQIKAFVSTFAREHGGKAKVLVQPYSKIPEGQITVRAWEWLDRLPRFDEIELRRFFDAHYGKCCELSTP